MSETNQARRIKRIRGAILVAMKMVYPEGLQAEQLFRSLLVIFPHLEWEYLKKDLSYLLEKGYLKRLRWGGDEGAAWRRRYFRLTAAGVEVADRVVSDQALEV